jgi:hypothetical protein
MKLKSFCTTKEMVSKSKRPPTEWEKLFDYFTSDKGLITRIYNQLKNLNSPKINEQMKWTTKEEIQMAKKRSPSLAIKEMQIKTN